MFIGMKKRSSVSLLILSIMIGYNLKRMVEAQGATIQKKTSRVVPEPGEGSEEEDEEDEGAVNGTWTFMENGTYKGEAVSLGRLVEYQLQSPPFTSAISYDNQSLRFVIIGSSSCIASVTCTGKIRQNANCNEEYLRIIDGVGGEKRYCGNLQQAKGLPIALQPTMGYRDLYLYFKTGLSSKLGSWKNNTGFKCKAKCLKPTQVTGTILPKNGKPKRIMPCACGKMQNQNRVVNGETAKYHEFTFQAALVSKGTRKPFCGGSLINDRFILTAAHCLYDSDMTFSDLEIILNGHLLDAKINSLGSEVGQQKGMTLPLGKNGSLQSPGFNLSTKTDEQDGAIRFTVKRWILHPLYVTNYDYDVCLVELANPVNFKAPNAPTPVCLPPVGKYSNKYNGVRATVIGWGRASENAGSTTRLLQKLRLPTIDLLRCNVTLPYHLTRRMICAGYLEGGKDACTGDSGGPLVYTDKNQYVQIGIVSWGEGCARPGSPGVYSRVSEFMEWVSYHTVQADARWCTDYVNGPAKDKKPFEF